jgi:hypothetical protein
MLARVAIRSPHPGGITKTYEPNHQRILSTIAIVIASVAFGILISADLGFMRKSNAQTSCRRRVGPPSPP